MIIRKRNNQADRWVPRVRRDVKIELDKTVRQASERAEAGMSDIVTRQMMTDLEKRLIEAKRPLIRKMVDQGAEFGKMEVAIQIQKASKKIKGKKVDLGDDEQSILHRATEQDIEKYLSETSKIETETTRKRLDKIFRDANNYWDEELNRGLTPKEVAKQILSEGLAGDKARAELLARTTTIWSMNEGTLQSYRDANVAVTEWMATEDDLTCDACMEMDGKDVKTGDAFLPADERLKVGDANINAPFDITHPPLHPFCRCAVIPVLSETYT